MPGKKTVADDSAAVDTSYYSIRIVPKGNYENIKKQCLAHRLRLQQNYNTAKNDSLRKTILDEARHTFTEDLLNNIIPFWYHTKWAFEGYTAQPGKGEVACGYFVSTTLKHVGLNIDRYRLAQKNPETEARSIQLADSVPHIENLSPQAIKELFAQEKKDGLYFIGLDSHVGFLLKRRNELFFIHSNYIGDSGVTVEKIAFSQAFAAASHAYLAEITHNDQLLKSWIRGTEIKVR